MSTKKDIRVFVPHCDPVKPQKSKPAGGKSVDMILTHNIINIWCIYNIYTLFTSLVWVLGLFGHFWGQVG